MEYSILDMGWKLLVTESNKSENLLLCESKGSHEQLSQERVAHALGESAILWYLAHLLDIDSGIVPWVGMLSSI